jgi:hypothetical protein
MGNLKNYFFEKGMVLDRKKTAKKLVVEASRERLIGFER